MDINGKAWRWNVPLVATTLAVAGGAGWFHVRAADAFFHVAAGRLILETGRIAKVDPFSFTFRGAPWHNHSPLFQVVVAYVYKLLGYEGLTYFQSAMAILLAASTIWFSRRAGASLGAACFLTAATLLCYLEVLCPRPHLFAFMLLQVFFAVTLQAERLDRPFLLWGLPFLYGIWIFSHGSHVLQCMFMTSATATYLIQKKRRLALTMAANTLVCIAIALLVAPEALTTGVDHVASDIQAKYILEWFPVSIHYLLNTTPGLWLIAIWILGVTGLVERFRSSRRDVDAGSNVDRPSVFEGFSLLAMFVLALTSKRMTVLLALGMAPVWISQASELLNRIGGETQSVLRKYARVDVTPWLGAFLVTAAILGAAGLGLPHKAPFHSGAGLDASFPRRALLLMEKNGVGKRLFSEYGWGSYMMLHGYPKEGVFIDSRALTVYPPAFLDVYFSALYHPRVFDALAETYNLDSVLLSRKTAAVPLVRHLEHDDKWELTYADSTVILFLRKNPAYHAECRSECEPNSRHQNPVTVAKFNKWDGLVQ